MLYAARRHDEEATTCATHHRSKVHSWEWEEIIVCGNKRYNTASRRWCRRRSSILVVIIALADRYS